MSERTGLVVTARLRHRFMILAAAAVLATTLSACDEESDCVGEPNGEITIAGGGVDNSLPGGGGTGIGSVFLDDDPPHVSLAIHPGTDAQQEAAGSLEVGDSFTLEGTTYTLTGFCEDSAYLDRGDGAA